NLSLTQDADAYQWYFNGAPIPGANGANYTAPESGDYACVLTFPNGCSTTTDAVNVIVTATLDPAIARGLRVQPAPARETLGVAGVDFACDYAVTDMGGRIMTQGVNAGQPIDIRGLAPGVYIMRLELPEGLGHLRFVKE